MLSSKRAGNRPDRREAGHVLLAHRLRDFDEHVGRAGRYIIFNDDAQRRGPRSSSRDTRPPKPEDSTVVGSTERALFNTFFITVSERGTNEGRGVGGRT